METADAFNEILMGLLHWECRVLATGPPGTSPNTHSALNTAAGTKPMSSKYLLHILYTRCGIPCWGTHWKGWTGGGASAVADGGKSPRKTDFRGIWLLW